MKLGELIPVPKKLLSRASVPAGKAATAELGVIGVTIGIASPEGDTSHSAIPMPKYQTIPGNTQGVSYAKRRT